MARRTTENPGTEPALSRNRRGKSGGHEPALLGAIPPMEFLRGITPTSWSHEQRLAAVPAVIRTLRDPDPEVRAEAAIKLRNLGCNTQKCLKALLAATCDDEVDVRDEAIWALVKLGEGQLSLVAYANIALGKVEVDESDLEHLDDLAAIPVHMRALNRPECLVRAFAADHLEQFMLSDDERAAEAVIEIRHALMAQLRSPEPNLRVWALEALHSLGCEENVPAITQMLRDPEPDVRQQATVTLALLGRMSAHAIPTLRDCLAEGGERLWMRSLAEALASIAHPDAVPALTSMLANADATMRYLGARGLGKVGQDALWGGTNFPWGCTTIPADCFAEAVPALIRALGDGTIRVRRAALDALATIGEPDAATRAAVARLRDDPAPTVRQSVERFCRRWSIES